MCRISSVLGRAIAALPLAVSGGCAHFLAEPSQIVRFAARGASGTAVDGAVCTVSGARGVWTVVTPGELRLPFTPVDLNVSCIKSGLPNGYARIVPASSDLSWRGMFGAGGLRPHLDPVIHPPSRFPAAVEIVMGDTVVASSPPPDR